MFRSFRWKLVFFGITIAFICALPAVYAGIKRPWLELHERIERSHALLFALRAAVQPDDLNEIERFGLENIAEFGASLHAEFPEGHFGRRSPGMAFNMLVGGGRLLSPGEVEGIFAENGLAFEGYDYALLEKWYRHWERKLAEKPALRDLLIRCRRLFSQTHENANSGGFELADIYLMMDKGRTETGFFAENAAMLLESLPWWDATYPGEAYNLLETDTLPWRESYDRASGGKPGFYSNSLHDPERWYFPRFDTDEYGVWFTTWQAFDTEPVPGEKIYLTFNTDFSAAGVKEMMIDSAAVAGLAAAVTLIVLVTAAGMFSAWLMRPVSALKEGAERVMAGDYNHTVPVFARDEFMDLTEVFNRMVGWVREKTNLRDALAKILSEELADQAAQGGLVLGGRHIESTVMFTDFAGFSTITKSMPPDAVVNLLNMYFEELVPVIKKWGGFPDKFIGDAIVALFGVPVHFPDHADRAVQCAIELQRRMREINEPRRAAGEVIFEMRVGLSTGEVVAGAIGCDLKLQYTAIGATATLANRMETKCKIGHLLMTENTYRHLDLTKLDGLNVDKTPVQETVKGYDKPVTTYGIYLHDFKIATDEKSADPARCYNYQAMPRSDHARED